LPEPLNHGGAKYVNGHHGKFRKIKNPNTNPANKNETHLPGNHRTGAARPRTHPDNSIPTPSNPNGNNTIPTGL